MKHIHITNAFECFYFWVKIGLIKILLIISGLFLLSNTIYGQVNIGSGKPAEVFSTLQIESNKKGGLRLPQLTTNERKAITTKAFISNPNSHGLTIYNTDTNCIEYWNSKKWVSLCKGEANISFNMDPTTTKFPCNGDVRGPYIPSDLDDPICIIGSAPYKALIVVGEAFATIESVNATTGAFTIKMEDNPSLEERYAILRIINNCTGEYKEFILIQEGCTNSSCQPEINTPTITPSSTNICIAGAVYISFSPVKPGGRYFWVKDGVELTEYRNQSYCIASTPGTYRVYVGAIGCMMNASNEVTLTLAGAQAPNPIDISVTNGGIICTGGTVWLRALSTPAVGTIQWYKNGVHQPSLNGQTLIPLSDINDIGTWYAMIKNGSCMSIPSATVSISYDNGNQSLPIPDIKIDGGLCKGSSVKIGLNNASSYGSNVTVEWFSDTTLISTTGSAFDYTLPTNGYFILKCVVTDQYGIKCQSEVIKSYTYSGVSPNAPTLTGGGLKCSSSPVTISVQSPGSYTYNWYKDGSLINGATGISYNATSVGNYQAKAIAGGCESPLSLPVVVRDPNTAPSLTFSSPSSGANINHNSIVNFTVTPSNKNAKGYIWQVIIGDLSYAFVDGTPVNSGDNRVVITTNPTVGLQLPKLTADKSNLMITCEAIDECDNRRNQASIVVNIIGPTAPVCTVPSINSISMNPTGTVFSGTMVTLASSVAGTAPLNYQWKKAGSNFSKTGSNTASFSFSASTSDSGEYSLYVANSCGNEEKLAGTLQVIDRSVPDGEGKLSGIDCFDINSGINDSPECGYHTTRKAREADFTQIYTYEFVTNTTYSNLSWIVEESHPGQLVESYTINNGVSSPKISIKFKENLKTSNLVIGTTETTSPKITIYAVYKIGVVVKKTSFVIRIQDCQCGCGANSVIGSTSKWLNFMCHNLGADQSLDPFIWRNDGINVDNDIKGYYFQWGRRPSGHEKRSSGIYNGQSLFMNESSPSFFGKTTNDGDWLRYDYSPYQANRWGDINNTEGITASNKADNDPCPDGWVIPTKKQWASLYNDNYDWGAVSPSGATSNKWEWTGNGFMVGKSLYLPAAGLRNENGLNDNYYLGTKGYYWSASPNGSTYSWGLTFDNATFNIRGFYRTFGMSVRCVKITE